MLRILKALSKVITQFSYKHYKTILFISLIILILGGFFLRSLKIEPILLDRESLRGKEFTLFNENFSRFGESTPLVLLQRHPQVEDAVRNQFTDTLTQELKSMEEIRYVQSGLFDLSNKERLIQMIRAVVFQNPEKYLPWFSKKIKESGLKREIVRARKQLIITDDSEYRELIAIDVFRLRELLEPWIKDYMSNFKMSQKSGFFDSEDRTLRLIFAQPRGSGEDTKYCLQLTSTIKSKIEKIKSSLKGSQNITCEFAGKYGLTAQSSLLMKKEIKSINIVSLVLIFSLLIFVFRNLKVTLMCFLPIFFSMFLSLLVARFFFNPLKMVSIGFAAIILGLGIDITFHLSSRFFQFHKRYNSFSKAIKKTMNDCGPPLIIGIFTTGCGFFTLSFSRYSALRQLGVLTFISLILTLAVTFLLFPSVVRMLGPKPRSQIKLTRLGKIPRFLTNLSLRKTIITRSIAAALIIVSVIISTHIKFDMSLFKLLPKNLRSLQNAQQVAEKFGTSFMLSTQMTVQTEQLSEGIHYQKKLDQKLLKFTRNKKIAGFYSPRIFYVSKPKVKNNLVKVRELSANIKQSRSAFFRQLNVNGFHVQSLHKKYYNILEDIFDESTLTSKSRSGSLSQFLKKEGKMYYLQTYIWPTNELRNPDSLLTVSEDLEKIPTPENIKKELTGTYQVYQTVNKIIKKDFISISLWAGIIISLILMLFFRKFQLLILSLMPLFGAIPLTLAFVRLTSIKFSPALIGVIAIIIGIGIDDSVHLIYRKMKNPGRITSDILFEIAPVLTLTSLSTMICFLTLVISASPLLTITGAIVGFGVFACWFFTMFLLPSFLKSWIPHKKAAGNNRTKPVNHLDSSKR